MTGEEGRQIAMVIDLNKCMGCQTCVVACKVLKTNDRGMDHQWWMKVNTVPGRGYPKDWERMGGGYDAGGAVVLGARPTADDYGGIGELPYLDVFLGGHGADAHLAPERAPTWGPNWDEDIGGGTYPNAYFFYLPRLCNHCTRPACGDACPYRAIRKDADGIVTIDEDVCATCPEPLCMSGCPYKEVYFNPVRHAAQKCDGCATRLAEGVAPACVRQCPGRCIWVGFRDDAEGTVHALVDEWRVALPLHAEYGTRPNVYYVPPLAPAALAEDGEVDPTRPRIPPEELRRLFGPEVDAALATIATEREKGDESELMRLLIARRWSELLGPWTKDPSEVSAPQPAEDGSGRGGGASATTATTATTATNEAIELSTAEAREAGARSGLYLALARGFSPPGPDEVRDIRTGSLGAAIGAALRSLGVGEAPTDGLGGTDVGEGALERAYLELFEVGGAGITPCHLYEGEFGGGRMGVIDEVLRFYHWFGLRLDERRRERPDHIATELELMHALAFREAEAHARGEPPEPFRRAERDFLHLHLQNFSAAVAASASGRAAPFYPALARLAAWWCERDEKRLGSLP